MLPGEPNATVHYGEFAFSYQHLAGGCEVHEEVGVLMISKQSVARSVERESVELWKYIKRDGGSSRKNGHSFHN